MELALQTVAVLRRQAARPVSGAEEEERVAKAAIEAAWDPSVRSVTDSPFEVPRASGSPMERFGAGDGGGGGLWTCLMLALEAEI